MRKRSITPVPDTAPFEAVRASLKGWLVTLLAWMIDTLDALPKRGLIGAALKSPPLAAAIGHARRQVTRDLRETVTQIRMLLIAHAYVRIAPMIDRRIATNQSHRAAPRGFRFSRSQSSLLRQFIGDTLKGVHAGSLRERAERLRNILDNLDPLIVKVAARMARMLHHKTGPALVLVCAQDAARTLLPALAREAADSS